jgi:hypothetical protein
MSPKRFRSVLANVLAFIAVVRGGMRSLSPEQADELVGLYRSVSSSVLLGERFDN